MLALLQDSTNVERRGYTPSERAVRGKFDEIFARAEGRLFISCFSSSIHRIKLALDLAWEYKRKVALVGRSMTEATDIALDLGYIDIPEGTLIHPGQIGIVNEVFSPSAAEVSYARRVVSAFEDGQARGHGAVALEGKLLDQPIVERARQMLLLHEAVLHKQRTPPVERPAAFGGEAF